MGSLLCSIYVLGSLGSCEDTGRSRCTCGRSPFLDCKLLHATICNRTIISCFRSSEHHHLLFVGGELPLSPDQVLALLSPELNHVHQIFLYEHVFRMPALRRKLCRAFILWIQGLSNTVVSASGCYYSANDTILPSPDYVAPCGTLITPDTINCCVVESGNVCLSNSICYIPFSNTYYLSPCTDPTYSAPECPSYCGMYIFSRYRVSLHRLIKQRQSHGHQ